VVCFSTGLSSNQDHENSMTQEHQAVSEPVPLSEAFADRSFAPFCGARSNAAKAVVEDITNQL
tara:strand:- start:756 stop:944 length:189 start_codon:yes stop_codon:yes gene_type:complete